ncbi:MAG: carboxypeptidase-like regulatory domain-containing protein [Bacteroidota bacterium]|nr:carboxypeptidase-like regulatory domain-containing protein [Bacteroidota bacterium]
MKTFSKFILLILCIPFSSNTLFSQESRARITGRVTDANQQPLHRVNIIIKETDRGAQTDIQGEYIIDAYPGDVLLFSHLGMQAVEVRVKRSSSLINVSMIAASIEIEEVEIKTKAKTAYKSQKELLAEYPDNMNLIKTSKGILNKDLSSTSFRIVDGKDLSPGGIDFFNALQDHVPSMRVVRKSGVVVVYLRQYGISEYPALFEVDGFPGPPPTYLSAGDIDRIAVLERNAAFVRYGTDGAGGVIVVNTKAQTLMDDMGVDRSEEHRLFLDSVKMVSHLEPYSPDAPPHLEELQKVTREKKALAIVAGQENSYLNNPYYFLDMYDFFISRWGNTEKSKELSQYITENFSDDISVLKAFAYLQQQHGYYLNALSIYLSVLKSQPWYAQSLRDVANAYAEVGDNEKAWMYYTQYVDIVEQLPNTSFDAHGEDLLITTEMMNILDRNKEVSVDGNEIETGLDGGDPQTRLVFEWNNPEADFELQFVTPEGFYDTWGNKSGKNASQNPEAENRYYSKQFFLGKENVGLWRVNIDYNGNNSEMPTYLKLTVYRDYGLPSQQREITVYKLSKNLKRVQLFSLQQI